MGTRKTIKNSFLNILQEVERKQLLDSDTIQILMSIKPQITCMA